MTEFDVEKVLQQLSLKEKISLVAGRDIWHTNAVPRLGIPSMRFSDGPNGIRGVKIFDGVPGAVLPNGTGLASTFSKDLWFKAGELAGIEARDRSVHVNLGPTANIQRGPLGGRGFESFSEDPYLSGVASAHVINGLQSQKVAATMKHYVCNDLEHERSSSNSLVTTRALREIYLEPFRLAVKLANPKAFMTGYNKINGEHVSQSRLFLQKILREEWSWDGCIMSDWFGTYTCKDSMEGGLDIEMPGPPKFRTPAALAQQIDSKELHLDILDDRVRGVLKLVKFVKESSIPEDGPANADNNTPETSKLLRALASESIVLLKNEGNILPLQTDETFAVIGPNAKYAACSGGGSASLIPYYSVTPFEGITNKLETAPKYTVGAYAHVSLPPFAHFLKNPKTGNKGIHATFYHDAPGTDNRRAFDEVDTERSYHVLFDYQNPEITPLSTFYIDFEGIFRPEETGYYEFGLTVFGTAQLFVNDQLVVDNKTQQTRGQSFFHYGTIQEVGKIHLSMEEEYHIRIEFGSCNTYNVREKDEIDLRGKGGIIYGCAKIIDPQEEIAKAVDLAKSVDKAILVIGTNGEWESESYDRQSMTLPGYTDELVQQVLKANPNSVVVNQSGTPVEFPWIKDCKALVQAWFGGNELGNAIADVLFGDVNPSGKLSLTFPERLVDNPTFLSFKTEMGRVLYGEDIFVGYRYYDKLQKKVLFPFGYGLSYTTFQMSSLGVEVLELENRLVVTVKIKNVGKVRGKQVIQIYISKSDSDIIRPVKELKGFEKIELEVDEERDVTIELSLKDSVSYFNEWHGKWCVLPGEYLVQVGSSSDDIELVEKFSVVEGFMWTGL